MESCPQPAVHHRRCSFREKPVAFPWRDVRPANTLIWYSRSGDIYVSLLQVCSDVVHVPALYCTLLYFRSVV
jgi:hypothetical protein